MAVEHSLSNCLGRQRIVTSLRCQCATTRLSSPGCLTPGEISDQLRYQLSLLGHTACTSLNLYSCAAYTTGAGHRASQTQVTNENNRGILQTKNLAGITVITVFFSGLIQCLDLSLRLILKKSFFSVLQCVLLKEKINDFLSIHEK